jgi:hypothetical protein
VTLDALKGSFVSPVVQQQRAEALIRRERDQVVSFARINGAAHAAMHFNMAREEVVTMVSEANERCKAALVPAWRA